MSAATPRASASRSMRAAPSESAVDTGDGPGLAVVERGNPLLSSLLLAVPGSAKNAASSPGVVDEAAGLSTGAAGVVRNPGRSASSAGAASSWRLAVEPRRGGRLVVGLWS